MSTTSASFSLQEDMSNQDANPRQTENSVDIHPLFLTVPARTSVHLYGEQCTWNMYNTGGYRFSSHFTLNRWQTAGWMFWGFQAQCTQHCHAMHTPSLHWFSCPVPKRCQTILIHPLETQLTSVTMRGYKTKQSLFHRKTKANTLANKASSQWGHWLVPLHRAHNPTVNSSGIKVTRSNNPTFVHTGFPEHP